MEGLKQLSCLLEFTFFGYCCQIYVVGWISISGLGFNF